MGHTAFRLAISLRFALVLLLLTNVLALAAQTPPASQATSPRRIVIAADNIFDGKGGVLQNRRIVVEGSKIVAIEPMPAEGPTPAKEAGMGHPHADETAARSGPVDYDLRGLTVMPGWIDAHDHITWIFGKDGKNAGMTGTSPYDSYSAASNAWVTLMAGFTTIQSVGALNDVPLRDAIARGEIPGPRILTAIEPLVGKGEDTGTPDQIREFIRKQKAAGADLIKIFASKSIRQGGGMTLSWEQLDAACSEAKKQGLRTLVHAYKEAVRAATLAGCTEIEHGTLATEEDLKIMAEHGTYFDPQAGLIIKNYLQHKERYLGTPGYPPEGFDAMEKMLSVNCELVREAAKTKGLKMVFGTDAVAGMHGRNAEEFIERVNCGVEPMQAMVSAQSLGAEAMGLGDQIGLIAPEMQADIIALDGDPTQDMTAVRRVVFVMKGGVVYKNVAKGAIPAYAGVKP